MFETPGLYKVSGVSCYSQNITEVIQSTQYIDGIVACPTSGYSTLLDVYIVELNDSTPGELVRFHICLKKILTPGNSFSVLSSQIVLPPNNVIVANTDRDDTTVDFLVSHRVVNET